MDEKTLKRFWSKVNKDGPVPEHCPKLGPCWVWTASKNADGYGKFRFSGRSWLTNRLSVELHGEAIPSGLCALHRCDNPSCVNPAHLYTGSRAQNDADRDARGRTCVGEKHPLAKLDANRVRKIRALAADGISQGDIGILMGVCQTHVSDIVRRKKWRHV